MKTSFNGFLMKSKKPSFNGFVNKIKDAVKRLISITTPTTVVASAYTTSANARPVRLSNGWLIAVAHNGAGQINIYKSSDGGTTWSQLCYTTSAINGGSFALTSNGTNCYLVYHKNDGQSIALVKFDAATVSNINLSSTIINIETGQSAIGSGVSIEKDSNGYLHATWCSKNATYPNSFNIRYSKSTDGGATWAAVTQVTSLNTTGQDRTNPTIVVKSDNNPVIIYAHNQSTFSWIYCQIGPSFGSVITVYAPGGAYTQSNPSAVVDSLGNIHVAWHGVDSTDTSYNNIRYSKSTDGGATWTAAIKLTSGNTYSQEEPTITADLNNNIYILWGGITSLNSYWQLRKIIYSGSAWGSIVTLTSNTSSSAVSPSSCSNYTNFTDPICIYKDYNVATRFRGVFVP